MTKGVLVVAHGSRARETEETLVSILEVVKEKMPTAIIEHAFMEFSDKTLESGIASLVAKNVSEIKVVPYFLFAGIHLKEDIPAMLNECVAKHRGIKWSMEEPLGFDRRLAEILVDRISR